MLDRAIVGIVLVALLFGLTCLCMGAIKLRGLEQRVDLLNKQVEELQKQTRVARQDVDFIIKLTTEKIAGAEND
jgi:cell division protein FtsB